MPSVKKGEQTVVLRFGGGLNTSASEADIADNECADGYNFDLDVSNREYRPRAPFVLCGTAPNASRVNGFISFRDADGNVSLLVQAGDTVYEYNGVSTWTSRGTVSSSARLRGQLAANSPVDDVVLITDLALIEPVMQWNGTTLADVVFTNETTAGFGEFRARYCLMDNERAIFANVYSNGSTTPNLIVGSKRGLYTQISVANRPSSSLGDDDPWFLAQPDNGAINGLAKAYGVLAVSSEVGDTYRLTGSTARDFQMTGLFPRSGAQGQESMITVGSDIFFGRQGRIHSLITTANYGDVESEDVSLPISDTISTVASWTGAYNQRLQRAYWWPEDGGVVYVYHAAFKTPPKPATEQIADAISGATKNAKVSPWSKWITTHSTDFTPTAAMSVLYPTNGLEYVLFGDSSGNVYRLEGEYGDQDAGTDDVTASRLSKRFQLDSDASVFEIQGWISYRKADAFTVTLTIEASGEHIFDETITIEIPAATGGSYYGSGSYYGGTDYYGISFSQRVARQKFAVPGKPQEFQVRVSATEAVLWRIEEIGLTFNAAN